ncbi:hypothetical protein P43SY_007046 [Pythium insidiosum]|uniref:Protein kinase domain-containing protein n=1 Tax=Pythium insidiosum TaxID=114742 RepID=A0AAD5LV27_PYTIN|nr:hypothetical protein P43SY_007046 [Pythium insidiosum]
MMTRSLRRGGQVHRAPRSALAATAARPFLCLVLALLLVVVPSVRASCPDANTLVVGATNEDAIAFDARCAVRRFRVRRESALDLTLNASNLDLTAVRSYPRVYKLLLAGNRLDTFKTQAMDNDMEELNLRANYIRDLGSLELPRRLTTLDLSRNRMASIPDDPPWPGAYQLKSLYLDENVLSSLPPTAFEKISALQTLSLTGMQIGDISNITFPSSLTTLDLSENSLTTFPTDLAMLEFLAELNVTSNKITELKGARLPPRLQRLNMLGNPIEQFEIARSDVAVFSRLQLVVSVESIRQNCTNPLALREVIQDIPVCVLSDNDFSSSASRSNPKASTTPTTEPTPSASSSPEKAHVVNSDAETGRPLLSGKAVVLIGISCFGMGLLLAAIVFVTRRDKSNNRSTAQQASRVLESGNGGDDEEFAGSWVFDSPLKHNIVAILEEDGDRHRRGRSKIDDLLVYEIPLDEIQVGDVLPSKLNHNEMMYLAEYQGFQVVVHVLLRNKLQRRRVEREYIEQVRLASALEHVCIVQFIGITFETRNQSQKNVHKWKMGAVFEYMHNGSLASMLLDERTRREGQRYCRSISGPPTRLPSTQPSVQKQVVLHDMFEWYPRPASRHGGSSSSGQWRCKLTLALDVAMALTYLHSLGIVHGYLSARKVFVNDQGEAKLSGMDLDLAMNVSAVNPARQDVRASMIKARVKMMHIFSNSSITQSPAFDSSLMRSAGGAAQLQGVSQSASAHNLGPFVTSERLQGMKGDIYAFGLLLWELDTLVLVDSMKQITARTTTERGEEHLLLKFSADCPVEIQSLARRCWQPDLSRRPTALELQEELVRLLEGHNATPQTRSRTWSRRTSSSVASSVASSLGGSTHSFTELSSLSRSGVLSRKPSGSMTSAWNEDTMV